MWGICHKRMKHGPLQNQSMWVDADIEVFKKLDQLGIHLIAQMVPNDKAEDFTDLLIK